MTISQLLYVPEVAGVKVVLDDDPRLGGGGGGGGGGLTPTAVKTGAYAAAAGELVLCDASGGAFTVTAPASGTFGAKKIDTSANAVTVTAGGALIDGDATLTLLSEDSAATVVHDGANWRVLSTAVLNAAMPTQSSGSFVTAYKLGMVS